MARRRRDDPDAPHLDVDTIVTAALAVLDRDGFDKFSLRSVAKELGAANMSIYWYVHDRAELLTLMLDRVVADISLDGLPDDPRDALREMARRTVSAFTTRPSAVPLLIASPLVNLGENGRRVIDHLVGVLRSAGVDDRSAAEGTIAVLEWVTGHILNRAVDAQRLDAGSSDFFESALDDLDEANAPHLFAVAEHLRNVISAGTTEIPGIELVLDGLLGSGNVRLSSR
jgi:AcrR family transcriptional regulator